MSGINLFLNNYTVVMEKNGMIVGFGDINDRGYLDRLYVHKDIKILVLQQHFAIY